MIGMVCIGTLMVIGMGITFYLIKTGDRRISFTDMERRKREHDWHRWM